MSNKPHRDGQFTAIRFVVLAYLPKNVRFDSQFLLIYLRTLSVLLAPIYRRSLDLPAKRIAKRRWDRWEFSLLRRERICRVPPRFTSTQRIRSASAETKVRATHREETQRDARGVHYDDALNKIARWSRVRFAATVAVAESDPRAQPALSPNLNAPPPYSAHLSDSLARSTGVSPSGVLALTSYRCAGVPPGTTMTTATMVGTASPYRLKKELATPAATPPHASVYILRTETHRRNRTGEKKNAGRDGRRSGAHDDASARATSEREIRNVLYTRDIHYRTRNARNDDRTTTTAATATPRQNRLNRWARTVRNERTTAVWRPAGLPRTSHSLLPQPHSSPRCRLLLSPSHSHAAARHLASLSGLPRCTASALSFPLSLSPPSSILFVSLFFCLFHLFSSLAV